VGSVSFVHRNFSFYFGVFEFSNIVRTKISVCVFKRSVEVWVSHACEMGVNGHT